MTSQEHTSLVAVSHRQDESGEMRRDSAMIRVTRRKGPGAAVRTGRRTRAAAHVTAMRDADIGAISPRLALTAAGSEAIATPDGNGLGLFEEALAIPGPRVQFLYGERLPPGTAVPLDQIHKNRFVVN
jgi:hypothetical protein